MAGFVDKIQDYKYLGTWQDALTGKKHAPLFVRFHDNAAILTRFQATYFNEAGAVYYKHWLSCQQAFGAGHEDCRKIRWFTQQVASSIHVCEQQWPPFFLRIPSLRNGTTGGRTSIMICKLANIGIGSARRLFFCSHSNPTVLSRSLKKHPLCLKM